MYRTVVCMALALLGLVAGADDCTIVWEAGDVYVPNAVPEESPCVLLIHGGGWGSGSRADMKGVAEFLRRDLGCVVYNVDYRIASKATPWPACGDDCIAAAKAMLTKRFAEVAGVCPRQIWIIGASAGGHLALWTGLSLPSSQVAGIVSISGIADPSPDFAANCGRYGALFGGKEPSAELLDSMNPIRLIRPNGPKILLTHAVEDRVVPIASAVNFLAAYRRAGNAIGMFDYSKCVQPGLTGHCIWIPDSSPHKLIPCLEREIAHFIKPSAMPEPQPVKSAVEITALYYPGTEHRPEWDMIDQTLPEIKPLLGWYDEGNPEVVDWQIKWAVEHGITSFCVDWYWNRGYRRLEHWVKAFYRARHRKYLKWYMMYANHNQPGAHSTTDQIAVTKYWIDNYFKTPEYYTIDGKPVVCYWDEANLDRDFIAEAAAKGETLQPGEGIRRAFAISEKMAKDAGLPGIHWQLMWRTPTYDPAYAVARRCDGFSTSISYGFCGEARQLAPKAAAEAEGITYDMVVEGIPRLWQAKAVQQELPWWLPLPTGWDDRPRSFAHSTVIRERTPEKFASVCRAARAFCEQNGLRHVIIHPINEWQEGSYIEPNEQYGFGMYDAIRDAFCEKPADGWPKNLRPSDVGLGPYDYPSLFRSSVQQWEFDGDTTEGWYRQPYGGGEVETKDGSLNFWITRRLNFNIRQRVQPFDAAKYCTFRLRMRITPNEQAGLGSEANPALRLKWGTNERPIIEPGPVVDNSHSLATCPVQVDGQFHEYALDLAAHPDWKGAVNELWFEACSVNHARVAVDWMRFE